MVYDNLEDGSVFIAASNTEQNDIFLKKNVFPIIESFGLASSRLPYIEDESLVLEEIIKRIKRSSLVVAVINDRNPNVFFEVGLSISLEKPCIILSISDDMLDFFGNKVSYLLYNKENLLGFSGMLKEIISKELYDYGAAIAEC